MPFSLYLEEWRGWLPEESGLPDQSSALREPRHRIASQPGKSLPAMLRRRLNESERATCDILQALDPEAQLPLIFASRHGNTPQTLGMLETLSHSEPISPARFSMSVHNATLGVYSISSAHRRPLQALGACGDEFDAMLHEARGYLVEGHRAVVGVFCESPLAPAYQGYTDHPGTACAVGIRLSLQPGRQLISTQLSTQHQRSGQPTPLEVLAWLNGDTSILVSRQAWQLRPE